MTSKITKTWRWAPVGAAIAITTGTVPAVDVSTAIGVGADTYLTNDGANGPTQAHGAETAMNLREQNTVRMRHLYLRFDISQVTGDLSGATITLNCTQSNRNRPLDFYGVVDGATGGNGENWDENTTTFATAAGIDPATPLAVEFLRTAEATPTRIASTPGCVLGANTTIASTTLDDFIAADTNGVITFIVTLEQVNNGSEIIYFDSKESAGIAPFITFPNGQLDTDSDGLSDPWEIENFRDPLADPAEDDATILAKYSGTDNPDGDAFDNAAEEAGGSDPLDEFSIPGDIDGDELADTWEDLYFGNGDGTATEAEVNLQDGFGDPDGDYGSNEDEENAGSNPVDYFSFLDDDGGTPDGLNDWWEMVFFGNTTSATDQFGNNDGDSADNDAEYLAYSNPNDPDSFPGDIDADGLDDLWEDQYFGNNDGNVTLDDVAVENDKDFDNDVDLFTNEQEANGMPVPSDPNDPASVPGDADGDDLDDTFELNAFGDIHTQDGTEDSDGDLYTNEEEENAGTDPSDKGSFVDSEPDGLNDRWEELVWGNLTTASDPGANSDGDSFTDGEEYLAGSDPLNTASVPGDIDGDGLNDVDFEIFYFGSIEAYDGDDDPDGDFATNAEEQDDDNVFLSTDPTVRTSSPDTDFDTLGDAWEIHSFGDITTTDDPGERDITDPTIIISGDPDGDGFTNYEEYAAATNGNDILSSPDSDNDRLPDGYEIFYFGGTTTQTGTTDSDSDGQSNFFEYLAGTNPNDNTSTPDPGILTTAIGRGADTSLSNDGQNATTGPDQIKGNDTVNQIRNNQASRLHLPMWKFDVSAASGDLSNAVLRMHIPWTSGTGGSINVWGLIDGSPGEDWDEGATNYLNAPGILDSARNTLNVFTPDPAHMVLLGTFSPTVVEDALTPGAEVNYSSPVDLNLSAFLAADTDGVVTIIMDTSSTSRWHGVTAKEQGTDPAPAVIFPLGTVTPPPTGSPVIADISVNQGADTFTLTITGLANGAQYHLEQLLPGETTFSAVSGSTFTASADPETLVSAATLATTPTRLVRVVEGSTP